MIMFVHLVTFSVICYLEVVYSGMYSMSTCLLSPKTLFFSHISLSSFILLALFPVLLLLFTLQVKCTSSTYFFLLNNKQLLTHFIIFPKTTLDFFFRYTISKGWLLRRSWGGGSASKRRKVTQNSHFEEKRSSPVNLPKKVYWL